MTTKRTKLQIWLTAKQIHNLVFKCDLDVVQISDIAEHLGHIEYTDLLVDDILLRLLKHESPPVVESALSAICNRYDYRETHTIKHFLDAGYTREQINTSRKDIELAIKVVKDSHKFLFLRNFAAEVLHDITIIFSTEV